MNDATAGSAGDYCSNLVRTQDEDKWLASGYAPPPLRNKLRALHAFHVELRRIPSAVSEPPLGEIRLQWWRDALEEIRNHKPPRAHPVVEEIAAAGLADVKFARLFEEAIDAGAAPLYGVPFPDVDSLKQWFAQVDGAFDAAAVMLAGGDNELSDAARLAGAGLSLAREGRAVAPYLADDVSCLANKIRTETSAALASAPASIAPALLHLSLIKSYTRHDRKPFPLLKRVRLFTAMAFGKF
ncbi:squalene/phytoene synthase family protein [Hyphococcus flavus]|uniref:Squalene/phytoene synthase family protein n=1 Tax=Hyphococcus flavus TaxID=1866326 RepID=A0AAE9ZC79_9PROT|nr:squalene/phytoene synthase family protein [Hyphococcus flavus]WDI32079.1 squalene/phytoene synthase family protein [Hyphococcus flavus]